MRLLYYYREFGIEGILQIWLPFCDVTYYSYYYCRFVFQILEMVFTACETTMELSLLCVYVI